MMILEAQMAAQHRCGWKRFFMAVGGVAMTAQNNMVIGHHVML